MQRTLFTARFLTTTLAVLFLLQFATAQQRQALQTHAAAPVGAQAIRPLPQTQTLALAISLPLRNQEQLATFLQQLEDSSNPNYHHYLSSAQFTEQFGPTVEQYQQVIAFAKSHGFTITHTSPSRRLLNITGPVSAIEQTFQVSMQIYQHPTENRTYFAPNVEPTVEVGLPILGVSGLTDRVRPHPMLRKAAPNGVKSYQTGSGPGGQFLGSDFRAAYYGTGSLTGTGQALALSELGQWNMADVTAYFASVSQPLNVPIITELLGGTDGSCPGACDDGEEANDIIQIVSMAPGASVLIVYEDTSGNADVDIFDAFATENISKQMSWSFGIGDGNAAADEQYFAQFHAQGQNFFVASGDEGANLGGGGWPGFSSNITDVGGTDLATSSAGGPWSSETGWVGSGTGWCNSSNSSAPCNGSPGDTYAGIPTWQVPSIISAAGGNTTYRNVPDVSADANTDSFWCAGGTCQGGLGGTSLAAPRWAGFLALVNEQAAANGDSSVGFLSPLAWTIGQGSGYGTAFHDITSGCNPSGSTVPAQFASSKGFCAMSGFDMVTGWGTPNGEGTLDTLAPTSTTNPYFTLSASPSTVNLSPGGAPETTTITLTPANGFTGTMNLCATILGSPAGLTAGFSPTSITNSGTSTLTVTPSSDTPSGTHILVVTGNSNSTCTGTQPPQQAVYVTLALPDFSLSVSPTTPAAYPDEPNSIYLNQGGTASATVTVNQQNGFNSSVDLSVGGLPSGVTGSFSPTSTATTSDLALIAGSTAITGTDYLAVTGTSGSIAGSLNAPYTILSVSAATGTGGSGTPVNLSTQYNLPAIYNDGITFGTGMDGAGFGYSSNLLTGNRILNGIQFNFGPANTENCVASGQVCVNDAISAAGQTITLPSGQFTTLQLMATGIDGPVLAQSLTVTYSDGTTSKFTQNFSDWCSCSSSTPPPGQQPNEGFAVVMPYRDAATGTQDNRVFNLYAYTFVLNSSKTVQSLTLPAKASSGAVIVLAATLTTQSLGTPVNLANEFNIAGLFNNSVTFEGTGDIDGPPTTDSCTLKNGCTDAYSAQQLGLTSSTPPTLTLNGTLFNFGPVNTVNCGPGLTACLSDMIALAKGNSTVTLPSNQQTEYTTLTMLGTAVNGSQTGTVTINYASGSPTVINQTFSDWCNFTHNSNESIAVGGVNRINSDGTLSSGVSCNLYSYTYALDPTRAVESIELAYTGSTTPGEGAFITATTLSGSGSGTSGPSLTLSASPTSSSVTAGNSGTATITITPSTGYSGTVTLSCSIAPSVSGSTAPSCSFGTSSSVTIANGAPATATLTFTTVAPSPTIVQRTSTSSTPSDEPARATFLYMSFMMPVSGLAFIGLALGSPNRFRKKNWAVWMTLWLVMSVLVFLPSCGNGSTNGGGGGACSAVPGAPTGLTASGTTSSGTTLSWSAPTTTPSACTVTGYVVYQNGSQIASPSSATYNITGLNSGQQYSFTVAAIDSSGTSVQSTAASVSTGTQATSYTLTITATGTGGATQAGAPSTVQMTVTQ